MKNCELCKCLARTYCESDDASLCWNCDIKVHGANFLVARHERIVLCHACQSPTPWKASGADLGVTVTVCEACVIAGRNAADDEQSREEDDPEEIDDDSDDGDEEEDGENQVVPETPPPPASSSSSDESESCCGNDVGEVSEKKRSREVSSELTDQSIKRRFRCQSATQTSSCISLRRTAMAEPIRAETSDLFSESVIELPLERIGPKRVS